MAGQSGRFAVHFTRLDDFKPLRSGKVEVVLDANGSAEAFSSEAPSRPGIFGVDVKPTKAGEYRMTVRVSGKRTDRLARPRSVTVYPDEASAAKHPAAKSRRKRSRFSKSSNGRWSSPRRLPASGAARQCDRARGDATPSRRTG